MSHDRFEVLMTSSHVIITGTGRAGTTVLVQLLTRLGLDTGFDPATLEVLPQYRKALRGTQSYYEEARAGLELNINVKSVPYIIKTPNMDVNRILNGSVRIEHALIPVREFGAVARSRRNNQLKQTGRIDGNPDRPGGLWGTDTADEQVNVLRSRFSEIVEACVLNDIPITFLAFPRFLFEPRYLVDRLNFLLKHIPYDNFLRAFDQTVRSDWAREAANIAPPNSTGQ
jgi:hypothetical protein